MAKTEIRTSICVAESQGSFSKLRWRRIGDLARITSDNSFFIPTQETDPDLYLDCKNTPIASHLVKAFDWTAGAESEARVNNGVHIYELMECSEFSGLTLKNEDKIRNILKTGFFVHTPIKATFSKGNTGIVLAIGPNTGLVLDDKSKVIFEQDEVTNVLSAHLVGTPENMKLATDSLPVIRYARPTISYQLEGAAKPRLFVTSFVQEGSFNPYTPEEYAPIFFKRQLQLSAKTLQLSDERKLTKADISVILEALDEAMESESDFMSIMQMSSAQAAHAIRDGIRKMLPDIKRSIAEDSKAANGIRTLLWEDTEIRRACMEASREAWLKEADEKRDAMQKELSEMEKEKARLATLRDDCTHAEERLMFLEKEEKTRREAAKSTASELRKVLEDYRKDVGKLMKDTIGFGGGTTGSAPICIPGKAGSGMAELGVIDLTKLWMEKYSANTVDASNAARELFDVVFKRNNFRSIAVHGSFAQDMATDIASVLACGEVPSIVIRGDETCSTAALMEAVEEQPTNIVLIEGVLASAPDIVALTLARHTQKMLIFSLDDTFDIGKLSATCNAVILRANAYEGLRSEAGKESA